MSDTDSRAPAGDQKVVWYFDFISPFAYLQHELLLRRGDVDFKYQAVLLAGLLAHFGGKGPAEIAPKRTVSYQHCQWLAAHHGIKMRFPPAHPFNPLATLRLAIAEGYRGDCVTAIFRAIYADGIDVNAPDEWADLTRRLGIADADARAGEATVKAELRANTEAAIAAGVFGVPTLTIGERQFWGVDMTEMAMEYRADPTRFDDEEYQRLAELPVGAVRRG